MDRHGIGQCLGIVEVEARENPSGLAAANSRAASRSRIYVSSCDCGTEIQSVCCNRAGSIYVHTWHEAKFRAALVTAEVGPRADFGGDSFLAQNFRCCCFRRDRGQSRRGLLRSKTTVLTHRGLWQFEIVRGTQNIGLAWSIYDPKATRRPMLDLSYQGVGPTGARQILAIGHKLMIK